VSILTWPPPRIPGPPLKLFAEDEDVPGGGAPAAVAKRRGRVARLQPACGRAQTVTVVRAQCKILLPKARQAQALDLKMLLHADFALDYTDMVVQYRCVLRVLNAPPNW
jgi:hypothetical protein